MRSEQELRDALTSRAEDAPQAGDVRANVLARVRAEEPRPRRRWLGPLVVATAVAAVGVGIGVPVALSGGGTASSSANRAEAAAGKAASAGGASSAAGAGGLGRGATPSARAAGALCRPEQVTLAVTWHNSVGVLTATNHSVTACRLPTQAVLNAYTTSGAKLGTAAPTGATTYGRLPAGAKATATVTQVGCPVGQFDSTVRTGWGTGQVTVAQAGNAAGVSCPANDTFRYLRTTRFTGLS